MASNFNESSIDFQQPWHLFSPTSHLRNIPLFPIHAVAAVFYPPEGCDYILNGISRYQHVRRQSAPPGGLWEVNRGARAVDGGDWLGI